MPDDIKIPLKPEEVKLIMNAAAAISIHYYEEANTLDALSPTSYANGSIVLGSGNPRILDPWQDWMTQLQAIANEASLSFSITSTQLVELSKLIDHFHSTIPTLALESIGEFVAVDRRDDDSWTREEMHNIRHNSASEVSKAHQMIKSLSEMVASKSKLAALKHVNQGPASEELGR